MSMSELSHVGILPYPLHRANKSLSMYAQPSVYFVENTPVATLSTESSCPTARSGGVNRHVGCVELGAPLQA